jgi:hypothetical protein
MAFRYSPKIVTNGLVFLMDFKNKKSYSGSGSTTTDIINQKSGTVANGATYDGNLGFEFDGLDDQINLGSIPSTDPLSLPATTGAGMTFDIWMNATSGGDSFQRIIDKSNGGSAANGFAVTRPNSNTSAGFELYLGGRQRFTTSTTNYYTFGNWVNITVSCDVVNQLNDFRSVGYVNGSQILTDNRTNASVSDPTTTTNCKIATWNHSTGREFKGTIGRIGVYNRVLTPTEILQNHNEIKLRFGL